MRVLLGAHSFQIDEVDWLRLQHLPWRAALSPSGRPVVTRQTGSAGAIRNLYIYQEIVQPAAGQYVDHINGDPSDHRRCNLRLCTPSQNSQNRRPRKGTSPFKGVSAHGKKWIARIKVDGRVQRLGCFACEADAAHAYDAAAHLSFGDFAWLNASHFPELAHSEEHGHA